MLELISLIVAVFGAGFTAGMAVSWGITRHAMKRITERAATQTVDHLTRALESEE